MEEEKGCQSDLGRFPKTYPLISEINGIAEMTVLFVFRCNKDLYHCGLALFNDKINP
jgi:hypothetical protein